MPARPAVVRWALYAYFSFLCALLGSATTLLVWLRLGGSAENLLGVGLGFVAYTTFSVVLAILVIPRMQKLNEPIDLTKWLPLCVVATVLGVVSFLWMFSATV
jgi:hypothetical protein